MSFSLLRVKAKANDSIFTVSALKRKDHVIDELPIVTKFELHRKLAANHRCPILYKLVMPCIIQQRYIAMCISLSNIT